MRSADTLAPRVSDDSASPDAASQIRILICDDHALVRGGIRRLLETEQDFEVVAEAPDAAAAVAGVGESAPDVVVMDVRMPGASGIEACREIRARFPATRVLMLTSFDDDETRCASIVAGASGYILKQIGGDGLVDGIREVAAGNSLFSSHATESRP
jgi:two-component system, NarL family, response regulator DevR